MNQPKILIWDIETAPAKVYTWGRWKQNIGANQVIREGYILCWAAKWLGEDSVIYDSIPNHGSRKTTDDSPVVATLAALLNEADIAIAHNGDGFDLPWVNRQLIRHGYEPTSLQRTIDTLKVAKKHFNFPGNRLADLAEFFDLGFNKLSTSFDLWTGCMEGDKESWDYMVDYCIQDIDVLEQVYLRLRPFIRNHPNVGVYEGILDGDGTNVGDDVICPNCGNRHLARDGYYHTNVSTFQRYKCTGPNGCGRKNIRGRTNLRTNPIEVTSGV